MAAVTLPGKTKSLRFQNLEVFPISVRNFGILNEESYRGVP